MKKIKIRFRASVVTDRASYVPGDVAEWEEKDALRLIEAGYAERA